MGTFISERVCVCVCVHTWKLESDLRSLPLWLSTCFFEARSFQLDQNLNGMVSQASQLDPGVLSLGFSRAGVVTGGSL